MSEEVQTLIEKVRIDCSVFMPKHMAEMIVMLEKVDRENTVYRTMYDLCSDSLHRCNKFDITKHEFREEISRSLNVVFANVEYPELKED